jgi:hypothetical protein
MGVNTTTTQVLHDQLIKLSNYVFMLTQNDKLYLF